MSDFLPSDIRPGTMFDNPVEYVPELSLALFNRLLVELKKNSVASNRFAFMVGDALRESFDDCRRGASDMLLSMYFDPYMKELPKEYLGVILGTPIFANSDLNPYALIAVSFAQSRDGKYDAQFQTGIDLTPNL